MHPTSLARTQGEKPAVVMAQSGASMSYAQLEAYSNQGAQLLRALGLERGDTVALMLDNTLPFLAICLAAQRAGLFYVAMSSRLAEPEAAYVLDNCGAEVFIVSAALAQIAAGLMTQSPHVAARFSVGGPLPGHQSWEAAAGAQPTTPIADESLGQDMLYSSGTTGRPKGVRTEPPALGVGEATRLVGMLQTLYRFDADTIYLGPAPLYHAAPLRYAMSVLNLGGTVVVMEHFDAEAALALIETHRITHAQFVPTMFVRMLKLPEETRRRYDLSSLKAIIHAAAPCPVPVKEKMIDWWGPIIHEYYAGTEGNGMTVCDSAQWLAHKGTVGRAALGEVRILDEAGAVLPPGRAGCISPTGRGSNTTAIPTRRAARSRPRAGRRSAISATSTPRATSTSPTARPI